MTDMQALHIQDTSAITAQKELLMLKSPMDWGKRAESLRNIITLYKVYKNTVKSENQMFVFRRDRKHTASAKLYTRKSLL